MQNKFYESTSFQDTLSRYEKAMRDGVSCYMDSEDFLDLSNYYVDKDQPEKAEKVLHLALSIHTDNVQLKVAYIGVLIYMSQYEKAESMLQGVSEEEDYDVLYLNAQLECGLRHDYEKADKLFEEWLRIVESEEFDVEDETQDMVEDEESDSNEARKDDFPEMDTQKPSLRKFYFQILVSLYELGDAGADRYIRKWIELYMDVFSPLGGHEEDVMVANMCSNLEFYDLVERAYTMLLDHDPYQPQGWTMLGVIQQMKGNTDEAVKMLEFALAVNPEDIQANGAMGNCLFSKCNYEQALKYFLTYRSLSGQHNEDFHIGACYLYSGKVDQAIQCFDSTFDMLMKEGVTEENAHLYNELAEIYYYCKTYDKALTVLQISEPYSLSSNFYLLRGCVEMAMGNMDAVMISFEKALDYSDDTTMTICEMSAKLIAFDYDNYAEKLLNNVMPLIQLTPECTSYDNAYALLGLALYKQFKINESLKYFKIACEKVPDMVKYIWGAYLPDTLSQEDYYDYLSDIILNPEKYHVEPETTSTESLV